ncbi:hypothetical protein LB503_011160 [Fusarium chuoi]|nr:hypothetical protein LB503_011160 [Fusarium chuoi]
MHKDSPPLYLLDASLSHPVKPQRKVTPTKRKSLELPSPPSSSEHPTATAADELPEIFVVAKRYYERGFDVTKRLTSVPLSNQDYVRFLPEVEATFHRFDYDARRGRLVIRMPSRIHDLFADRISNAIVHGLSELGRNNEDLLPLTAKIHKGVTSDISLYDTDGPDEDRVISRRSPDGQFFFGSGPATVVIEVAYSQDEKRLSRAAMEYIHYSCGEIKSVLCFSLNKSEGSTISVWKPVFYPEAGSDEVTMDIEQVVKSQPFRTADGTQINQDHELVLDLHDFIPDTDCDGYSNPCISIPYSKLYDSLVEVEQLLETPRRPRLKHGVKRLSKLPDPSYESMAEEDKKFWRLKDRAKRDRLFAEDGEYEGSHIGDEGENEASHNGEERPPKRRLRECTKPPIVELDSNEAAAS